MCLLVTHGTMLIALNANGFICAAPLYADSRGLLITEDARALPRYGNRFSLASHRSELSNAERVPLVIKKTVIMYT